MGSRGNLGFIINDNRNGAVWLYTHWHGHNLEAVATDAIEAARPRWGDPSYATRIALTRIIGGITDPTGWGVSTMPGENEHPALVIDWEDRTITRLNPDVADLWDIMEPDERRAALAGGTTATFDQYLADGGIGGITGQRKWSVAGGVG